MEIGKATAIFKNIGQVAASDAEKIEAINEVLAMSTHNGITKTDALNALNWAIKYCCFLEFQNISIKQDRDFIENDIKLLERRLKHLLQSDFIRSFDKVDIHTKEYKRDIREADAKILYLCDGEKCGPDHDCLECKHTKDINHARNFKRDVTGAFWEKYEKVCVSEIKPKIIKNNQAPTQPLNWIRKNNRLVCPVCESETEKYTNFCSVCETFLT